MSTIIPNAGNNSPHGIYQGCPADIVYLVVDKQCQRFKMGSITGIARHP